MTNNKLLDSILNVYLYGIKLRIENDPKHKMLTFDFVAKSQEPNIKDWQIEFLRKTLFDDGFLENCPFDDMAEPYELTPAGVKAAQNGWYTSKEEEIQLEIELKKRTITSLKLSKTSLIISIFAIVIPTIISIYSIWISKDMPTQQQFQELKHRIKAIENQKNDTKTKSTDARIFGDTLANINK